MRIFTYLKIVAHYRQNWKVYTGAKRLLSKKKGAFWLKLLQARVFPNPVLYRKLHPEVFWTQRKFCDEVANSVHMVWTCPSQNDGSHTPGKLCFRAQTPTSSKCLINTTHFKYLELMIMQNLSWSLHISNVSSYKILRTKLEGAAANVRLAA